MADNDDTDVIPDPPEALLRDRAGRFASAASANGNRRHLELIYRALPDGRRMVIAARINGMDLRMPRDGAAEVSTLAGHTEITARLDLLVDAVDYVPETESVL